MTANSSGNQANSVAAHTDAFVTSTLAGTEAITRDLRDVTSIDPAAETPHRTHSQPRRHPPRPVYPKARNTNTSPSTPTTDSHAKTQPPRQKPPTATGRNNPAPVAYLVLPPRLPRQVRALPNETLASYLGRLAIHNGLAYEYFSSRISRMRASPLDITQALTGKPASTLQAALPELRLSTHLRTKCGVTQLHDFDGINPACELCAASHGNLIHALVWNNGHDAVCQRHQRWLGSALQPSTGQIDLQRAPEILTANQHHRRLARRHGQAATRTAFTEALQLIDDMQHRNELPGIDDLILRLLNTPQPYVQIATPHPQVQAAHYPAAAGLTAVLLQPNWINNATATPQTWKTAAPQLAAAIAIRSRLTDYTYIRLSRWNYNRQHDPAAFLQ